MVKFILAILLLAACGRADPSLEKSGRRQEKFLFYDESGRMVNIFNNPYLQNFLLNAGNLPLFWNFLNPFFNYLRPLTISGSSACYMIPVSDQVIQNVYYDPVYQNKLVIPKKEPVIEPNPLCTGRRGSFSSPKSCNAYMNCWDGWAFEQECPAGLMFSNAGYCDYADKVDCQSRSKPKFDSPCAFDFQTYRNKENCNEFFVCVSREPIKFKCPADLSYSEVLGVCDYKQRVNCGSVPLADTPELPGGVPTDPPTGAPSSPPISTDLPSVPTSPPSVTPSDIPSIPSSPPSVSQSPSGVIPNSPIETPSALPSMPSSGPLVPSIPFQPFDKGLLFTNSLFRKESWLAASEAMSRQDAIRQLLSTIAKK